MDLVSNVMLGNSPTPQPGAPAGKVAGGGFASLFSFIESMDGEAAQQSVNTKTQVTGKNAKPGADTKRQSDAAQLAALNLPVALPQVTPPASQAVSNQNAGPVVSPKDDFTKNVKAGTSDPSRLLTPADAQSTSFSNATAAKTSPVVPTLLQSKANAQDPVPQSEADPKTAADPQPIADKTQVAPTPTPEPSIPAEPKTAKSYDTAKAGNMAPLKKAVSAAVEPVQAAQSLAASAVKVALKQTLPAQSKIAATVATGKLPTTRAFAAGQSAVDVHPIRAHATAQPQESQPVHDQPKKQEEAATVATQGVADNQPAGQVNAVARVVSSDLSSESPKQGSTTASATPVPVKPDASTAEPPVLPNSAVALQSARLLQNLGQSELRVGMKMGDLGNVEIRTQLRHDQLHAEISVERGDLSHTLAAELPALQQRLREHDLPAASIVVNHQAPAGFGGFERGPQQQQQTTTPMSYAFGIDPVTSSSSPEETRIADSALDVRI